MGGTDASSFWILWISRTSGRNKFPWYLFLVIAPGFRFRKFQWFLTFCLSRQVSPLLCPSTRQSLYFSRLAWELDAASNFQFLLPLASGFPLDALSIPKHFDAIGCFTDEELVETIRVKFHSRRLYFAATLSYSFCSCTLIAIVSVCSWSNWNSESSKVSCNGGCLTSGRRLFHSSRVKFPFLKMSASWWLVSVYRIWIFGSTWIRSNSRNQSNLVGSWHVSHCWTLAPSLSSLPRLIYHSTASKWSCVWRNVMSTVLDPDWRALLDLGFSCGVWCFATGSLRLLIFGFVDLIWWGKKYFNHQVPKIKRPNSLHARTCIERNDFSFSRTLWNWSLFLAHPSCWHKCLTSGNA